MSKKKFTAFTYFYVALVILIFSIYAFRVMDANWEIDMASQRGNLTIFAGLIFIALILTAIDFAGINEKSNKVTKSTLYGGLSVAAFFLVWRLMIQIF